MKTYLAIGSFNPRGEAGYDIHDWNDGAPAPLSSCLPQVSAGVVFKASNGVFYLTDERQQTSEGPGGRIYAARFDAQQGTLVEISHSPSFGAAPSFCCVDPASRFLLVTHFGSMSMENRVTSEATDAENGSTVLFSLLPDGSIGEKLYVRDHGDGAHAHSVRITPDGRFFLVNDMGKGELLMLAIDEAAGQLRLLDTFSFTPGDGPRYSAFHPTRPMLFINCEQRPLIASFTWDETGRLRELDRLRLMSEAETEEHDKQSGFTINTDGTVLYSAIRGKNEIAVISVRESGRLTLLQRWPLNGNRPKDLALSPDGQYLACANRGSEDVEFFRVSPDGTLAPSGLRIEKKAAGFVRFFQA